MSSTNVSNNGVNDAGVYIEGVPWLGRVDPVFIKLLSKRSGQRKIIFVQWNATTTVSQLCENIDRLHPFWKEKGLYQVGEQRLCDQVRMIQKKGWLS